MIGIYFRQFKRVIGFAQVLFLAGRWLKRKGIRYTTIAIVLAVGAHAANVADLLDALLIPVITAIATFGLGNVLISISNLLSAERLLMADANAMNLMEDRKQQDMDEHLAILWERVYKYEARLVPDAVSPEDEADRIRRNRRELAQRVREFSSDLKRHFGISDDDLDEFIAYIARFRPLASRIETTREGFITSAGFSLNNSFPQKLEQVLTGYDLSLLEDWYDGAYFTVGDCKLKEQYAAHKTIRGIRKRLGIPWTTRVKEALTGHPDPIWHTLTMQKIGTSVGGLIDKFNKKYVRDTEPAYFDAQDFLWKHDKLEQIIMRRFNAVGADVLADLRQQRKKMIRRIFSDDVREAHRQIFHMFGRDYRHALNLRLDYDIEFAANSLDYSPIADIKELGELLHSRIYPPAQVRQRMDRASEILKLAEDFLQRHLPDVMHQPGKLRAARIGFYLDRFRVREKSQKQPTAAIRSLREKIIASEHRYTKRICLLRQHYELARMQLLAYVKLVDELGEYETQA